jgi:hypothetical protein
MAAKISLPYACLQGFDNSIGIVKGTSKTAYAKISSTRRSSVGNRGDSIAAAPAKTPISS